jgi:hypothetical protein
MNRNREISSERCPSNTKRESSSAEAIRPPAKATNGPLPEFYTRTCLDPVAVSIREFLVQKAAESDEEVRIKDAENGVRVEFASLTVQAETFDLAMIRMAKVLLEDERFGAAIVEALRGHMQS